MIDTIDREKIHAFLQADRFAQTAGIVVDSVQEDLVRCSMELRELHRNAGGSVQGGAIFTLADTAFAIHCNLAMLQGAPVGLTVGQSCSISYLRSTKGTRLIAESRCLTAGRTVSVYRVSVTDDLGKPVAEMIGNACTTRLPRPE